MELIIIIVFNLIGFILLGLWLRANITRNRKNILTMYHKYEILLNSMVNRVDVPATDNIGFKEKYQKVSDNSWSKINEAVQKKVGG